MFPDHHLKGHMEKHITVAGILTTTTAYVAITLSDRILNLILRGDFPRSTPNESVRLPSDSATIKKKNE